MANKNSGSFNKFMFGASLAFFTSGVVLAEEIKSVSPHANAVESILQQRSISGKILDANGEPIIGANVLVKGSSNGTIYSNNTKFYYKTIPCILYFIRKYFV